jgi:hypothetical protein
MKKLLAFILAFTVVFSMTAMFTPVSASGMGTDEIAYMDYLDFSGDDDNGNNRWAKKDAEGNYVNTSFKDSDFAPGSVYFPFALHDGYASGVKYEFRQGGEVIRLTAETTENPGISFQVDDLQAFPIGSESSNRAEYVKIRFKNNSPSTKLTFMGTNNSYSTGRQPDPRVSASIDMVPNSAEWQTVTISMVEGTMNSRNNTNAQTTGTNTWNSFLKKFAIYPFGYGNDNESILNDSYYVEIDYVVVGSKSYVDSYQSELEKKEDAVDTFEFASDIADKDGNLKPGIVKQSYRLGETLNLDGLKLDISYIPDKEGNPVYPGATVTGDSVSAVYSFDKPIDEETGEPIKADSWTSKVSLKYGDRTLTYDVTVYDIKSIEFKYETDVETDVSNKVYDKIDILLKGFTPTGLSVLIKHTEIDPSTGKEWETIKTMDEVELIGTEFAEEVALSEGGYYEYLVTVNYYGHVLYLPVKIIDVVDLEIIPVESKAGAIYYGTDLNTAERKVTHGEGDAAKTYTVKDYFDVKCVYTNGTKKEFEKTGLPSDNLSISGNTKTNGGTINATVKLSNTAYGINLSKDIAVTVQTPIDITVTFNGKKTFDVDDILGRNRFNVKYKYADGTSVSVDAEDPNLVFKYDTSTPGTDIEGSLEINGKKEATFKFGVNEAEFAVEKVQKDGSKVKLLAPKFPTVWLVTIIIAAVALVLVGGWAILKYVFKVDFKRKKKVSLDDIF